MTVCLFLTVNGSLPAQDDQHWLERAQDIPGVDQVLLHTPANASDPYLHEVEHPAAALQLYFGELELLEQQACANGALHGLVDALRLTAPDGQLITQQAMLVRRYACAEGAGQVEGSRCSYLVAYHGQPLDYSAWLAHYTAHHIPLMKRLPALRELELYTPLSWASTLVAPRSHAVQRNKVVFDSPEALTAALNSPLRHEMRADYHTFPPFEGNHQHFPMISRRLR